MPRKKFKEYQLERLKEMVDLTYTKFPYYRETFDKAGVKPSDIQSLEDLKKFFTINKKVLRDRQQEVPGFGDMICASEEDFCLLKCLQRVHRRSHGITVHCKGF